MLELNEKPEFPHICIKKNILLQNVSLILLLKPSQLRKEN